MEKLGNYEVRVGSCSTYQTIFVARELPSPMGLIELKLETVFSGAKDSQARQTKAQLFVDRGGLRDILELLSCLSNDHGRH